MIHKSSVVDPKAKISKNVKIGPFCYVGPNVILDDNVELVSNVHIEGNTKVGKGTRIFPFASIGTQPQDLKFKGEKNSLEIGENNLIREYVTINPGTADDKSKTTIGNNCLFMISSHIAHDCIIGNNVIIANNVPLGGHVTIEDSVVIGGNSAVQQFTRIGRLAMIGGMTGVLNDVIPYGLSIGNRNYLKGLNLIGLKRAFLKTDAISSTHHEGQADMKYHRENVLELSKAYHEIFATKNLNENIKKMNGVFKKNPLVKDVIDFIGDDKKRSICTPFSKE
jgi:UDP-N-acetylglucosamine acyltransferase